MTEDDIKFYKELGVLEYLIQLAEKQVAEARETVRSIFEDAK